MQIIIPMSGEGVRFKQAGYKDIKPLIKVDGKPIIEHVVGLFPGESDFVFVCNQSHLETTELKSELERICPTGKIVPISPHKRGPVHAVLRAKEFIKDSEPVIVNYCDFAVEWDYAAFKGLVAQHKYDGCITAYKDFHPHSLGPTLYGYIKEINLEFQEIKEKESFTDNRMEEFASCGTYYFKSGATLKNYFERAIRENLSTNGEFYASLPYNLMKKDGLSIHVYEVEKFLQWGTPDDLEEYQGWSDYFKNEADWKPSKPMGAQCLIPMAGAGKRFKDEGFKDPKPLILVGNEPMIQKAVESMPVSESYTFVCQKTHVESYPIQERLLEIFGNKTQVLVIDGLTEGQACTCLLAEETLNPEQPLLIGACDNGMVWDEDRYNNLISDPSIDGIVFTFRNYVGAKRNPQMYGWVNADENGVIKNVSVKRAISDTPGKDPAVVGAFWFRKTKDFCDSTRALIARNERVNGEFYADSVINPFVESGKKAVIFDIDRYVCWGTPNDYRTWNYWRDYFSVARP